MQTGPLTVQSRTAKTSPEKFGVKERKENQEPPATLPFYFTLQRTFFFSIGRKEVRIRTTRKPIHSIFLVSMGFSFLLGRWKIFAVTMLQQRCSSIYFFLHKLLSRHQTL